MSLDIRLEVGEEKHVSCEHCDGTGKVNMGRDCVFDGSITHNLNKMAKEAGLYEAMWRPDEHGYKKAADVIPILEKGLADLMARPEYFSQFNPSNGWGDYKGLVEYVGKYLSACKDHPDADVSVCR